MTAKKVTKRKIKFSVFANVAFLEVPTFSEKIFFFFLKRHKTIIKMWTSEQVHLLIKWNTSLDKLMCWKLSREICQQKWRKKKSETIQLLHLLSIFTFCKIPVRYWVNTFRQAHLLSAKFPISPEAQWALHCAKTNDNKTRLVSFLGLWDDLIPHPGCFSRVFCFRINN